MIGLLLSCAILAAVAALGWRKLQQRRQRLMRPGATVERAVVVQRFDEIDTVLLHHGCAFCGAPTRLLGEFSRPIGERRYRVVRLACSECEREERVHFDVTAAFH